MGRSRKGSFAVTIFPVILSVVTFAGFGCYLLLYSNGSDRPYGTRSFIGKHNDLDSHDNVGVRGLNIKVTYPSLLADPANGAYPLYNSLLDIITRWNPDNPDPPAEFQETLQHFNFSNPDEMIMAANFRDAELPFKIYDVPEFVSAALKWDDHYLTSQFHNAVQSRRVEKSRNNHFMYWNGNMRGQMRDYWVPPTEFVMSMQFESWLQIAKRADEAKVTKESVHYYFMTNAPPSASGEEESFISRDLPSLSDARNNFFVTNTAANKGIQCRFGMRGIIAEAHYDSGRNMVAMIKGAKRYILNPPRECKKLGLITDKEHPSYRHSVIDWSDVSEATSRGFASVDAVDTILQAGEVLYIPSYWFHYIVSLKYSIQCNSRSGSPPHKEGQQEIEECLKDKLSLERYNNPRSRSNLSSRPIP